MSRSVILGPMMAEGFSIQRSGLQWLCADDHLCRPGEVVALCQLRVEPTGLRRLGPQPFAGERTLQAGLAMGVAGRLRIRRDTSPGGFLNVLGVQAWDRDEVIGWIEPETPSADDREGVPLVPRLLMVAGRRMAWVVDVDSGLLPGWNATARAWWGDAGAAGPTLLCAGFCDATGLVRGASTGFLEMFDAADGPVQMVHVSEHPLTPCAPFLLEQFSRTPAEFAAIQADLVHTLGQGGVIPTPEDLIFAGAVATQLRQSPLRDSYSLLGRDGFSTRGPAEAILVSLGAEPTSLRRHKTLGYCLHILSHDLAAAGPAVRAWLHASFETVIRDVDDIRRDYIRLFDTVGAATGGRFLILNQMSTSGREDLFTYEPFDAPLRATLATVAAKELDLMLHDLVHERPAVIIDADAAAAALGGRAHIPDGVHHSGALQDRLRREVLAALSAIQGRESHAVAAPLVGVDAWRGT